MVGVAAAVSWIDWRWILFALSAVTVLLPCGLLVLRGRLDGFEPLTWFADRVPLLCVARPAYDLAQQHFIYTERLISPTFTRMLVAGLLAGAGFAIGYLLPVAGSLASRIPRPRELEPRRLLIWAAIVVGVALVAFALFFVHAHGWRHPASFFFRGRARLFQLSSTPEATSKYFLASILLVVPAALFFLAVRHGVGERDAEWEGSRAGPPLASVLALLRLQPRRRTAPLPDRHAGGARRLLLPEARPASLGAGRLRVALVALTVLSAIRDLRLARARHDHPNPVQWLPWNAAAPPVQDPGHGRGRRRSPPRCSSCPSELHYTYGGTTIVGPFAP